MKNTQQKILLFFTLLCFSAAAMAQTEVSGRITDGNGDAVYGAIVQVLDASGGAVSREDGSYTIVVDQNAPFTLRASYSGLKTQEQSVAAGVSKVDFVLESDLLGFDEVVVTGSTNPSSKINSSISISTIKPEAILQTTPRTTAEIFRTIPGIRSESSGGEGNTNITVRGVPISAGGSKYLQLQEDGLPVMMFGDMAFATSDIFLRFDQNIARIEATRGGAASTMSSNAPAGIINFISKTGAVEGGSLMNTFGLDYNSFRTDFEYGAPIGNGLRYHVGGFYRTGEGPRNLGYTGNNGGQIKANLTKEFKSGYARIYYKHLNDKTAAYMPNPMRVSGTNADPTWESAPNFNANQDGIHSVNLPSNFGIGANGERRSVDVADGMNPNSNSIGAEFQFDLGNDWSIVSRNRVSMNSGRFVAPFTAAYGTTADMANLVDDAAGNFVTYTDGTPYTGSEAQIVHMFDTELKDFNNAISDTRLSKELDGVKVDLGYFRAQQSVNMAWLWNSYMMEANGDNARMLNVNRADSTSLSSNGQFAYGVPVWGCCQVQYNSEYTISAPYANIQYSPNNRITLDASVRFDQGTVAGVGNGMSTGTVDVNNDGVISPIEQSVATVNLADRNIVDYEYSYTSYSLGGNFSLNSNQAVFARYSHGASAKADRAVFPTGSYTSLGNPKDMIDQAELGWKQRFKQGGIFVTAFYAGTTEEGGFEASTQKVIENDYTAFGVELEGAYAVSDFTVSGAATYTKAEITTEGDANAGNTPRRQPNLMYSLVPSYKIGNHSVGFSVIGQTDAFAQDNNELVMSGYTVINGFVNFGITDKLSLSLNGNNLLDAIGITESEDGSIIDNQMNFVRARSITGRSLSASIRFNF
ncbi:MAG: TonB-dependent receptor [Bacteroidia bacterium]|nr:TonB-dependent receptor [Bacteroidia bacterium]